MSLASKTGLCAAAFSLSFALSSFSWALMPTNPESDRDFMKLPNGQFLNDIEVRGSDLELARGSGNRFTSSEIEEYQELKRETLEDPDHPVQWAFMDLDANRVIARSAAADRKIFGASVSKIFVAGALLDWQSGSLSSSQLQLMANMLVVSSNSAWTELQRQIGDGSSDRGRERIHAFTQRMGYERTRGFQGWWDDFHGNELTADELVEFLHDTYKGNYPGAEYLWKVMYTCRTGSSRAQKYLPSDLYVGGKTGSYSGPTVDPETGESRLPDGSRYRVSVRNHVIIFNHSGRQYALAVLADTGSNESAALIAGGVYHEYVQTKALATNPSAGQPLATAN